MSNRRVNRRQFIVAGSGASGAALLAAACSDGGDSSTKTSGQSQTSQATTAAAQATAQPKVGGVYRLRRVSQETHLSVVHQPYPDIQFFIVDSIYGWLWTSTSGGKVRLLAAEKIEQPDARSYVVTLKPHTFQNRPPVNGRPVTSEDVKLSIDFWSSEIPNGAVNQGYVRDELTYTTPDAKTITFTVMQNHANFFETAGPGKPPAPRELFANIKSADPVGSGPFVYKSRTAGSVFEVERNPAYHASPQPYLSGITSTVIQDDATAEASFIGGNLDRFDPAESQTAERIKRQMGSKVEIVERPSVDGYPLVMNMHRPDSPFADIRVRRAFYRAVNRDNLIRVIAFGKGSITGPVAPALPEALTVDEVKPYLKYDPNEAKQLLQQAGFPFDRTYEIAVGDSSVASSIAQVVAEDLKAVGIKTNVQPYPSAQLTQRTIVRGGQWDMVVRTSIGGAGLPRLFRQQHTDPQIVIQGDGLNQPDLDRMIEAAEAESDVDKRVKLWKDLQKQFLERYTPLMPLFTRNVFYGFHSYVKGVDTSAMPGWQVITNVWLDK